MIGLFGNEIPDTERNPSTMGWCQKWRSENGYHESTDKERRCKTCRFACKVSGNSRHYYKCQAMGWGGSSHSDVRLKNVCRKWQGGE